jgi:hypothetical protein
MALCSCFGFFDIGNDVKTNRFSAAFDNGSTGVTGAKHDDTIKNLEDALQS